VPTWVVAAAPLDVSAGVVVLVDAVVVVDTVVVVGWGSVVAPCEVLVPLDVPAPGSDEPHATASKRIVKREAGILARIPAQSSTSKRAASTTYAA
jgi:hypothetical protein